MVDVIAVMVDGLTLKSDDIASVLFIKWLALVK